MSDKKRLPKVFGLLLFSLLGGYLGWVAAWQWTRTTTWTVSMDVDHGNLARWYYDSGQGFSEREGTYRGFPAGALVLDFSLPSGVPRNLRFDPTEGEGEVRLYSIEWREPWPGGYGHLDFSKAEWFGVDEIVWNEDGSVSLSVVEVPSDPFAVWRGYPGWRESVWKNLRIGTAFFFFVLFAWIGYLWNKRVAKSFHES